MHNVKSQRNKQTMRVCFKLCDDNDLLIPENNTHDTRMYFVTEQRDGKSASI